MALAGISSSSANIGADAKKRKSEAAFLFFLSRGEPSHVCLLYPDVVFTGIGGTAKLDAVQVVSWVGRIP
jgi:hypothetical protein